MQIVCRTQIRFSYEQTDLFAVHAAHGGASDFLALRRLGGCGTDWESRHLGGGRDKRDPPRLLGRLRDIVLDINIIRRQLQNLGRDKRDPPIPV